MFQKFCVYFLAPTTILVAAILTIPELEKKISDPQNNYRYYLYAYIFIGAVINYFIYQFSPQKKYEKLKLAQWNLFEQITHLATSILYKSYKLKFNIMIPETKFKVDLEPLELNGKETKITYFTKVFKPIWKSKDSNMHNNLKFTINQGLCGQTFTSGTYEVNIFSPYLLDWEEYQKKFNFSEKQNKLIGDLKLVASCNIMSKNHTMQDGVNKPIAVLNVDSYSPNIKNLLADADLLDDLKEQIVILAQIISNYIEI